MPTVSIELDPSLTRVLAQRSQPIDAEIQEALVWDMYRRTELSSGQAAGILGMERLAFHRRDSEMGIPYIRYGEDELLLEIEAGFSAFGVTFL